ncbi:hypothetical protein IEQ34_013427 [Dendrobium chrysotoxum]|uniref:Uncharacterized protein n=1 Tax=Dendrobium chrysotoxum TaxID=161865 RepID=A0AAV7GP75_DENCH|nr:hypothetical protein IEQ34_013427 [Dendrobium chrysotoxum]
MQKEGFEVTYKRRRGRSRELEEIPRQKVRFLVTLSSASCTTCSDSTSRALVASSNSNILGSFKIALAMAILCFCPPDN